MSDTVNFIQLITGFRRGALAAKADEELRLLIAAIRETGGSGSLTIKIPLKVNKTGQIEITPTVEAKIPRLPVGTGIYFGTEDDLLSRRDPMQMDIEDEVGAQRNRDIN